MDSNRIKENLFIFLIVALFPGAVFAAPPSAWAGAYLGLHGGEGVVSDTHITQGGSVSGAFNMHGSMGGAQFGYNMAAGEAVLGLEAKGSIADITGSVGCVGGLVGRCGVKLDRLYTLQGNVGMSVGSILAYAFVGVASGQIEVRNETTTTYTASGRHTGRFAGVGGLLAFSNKLNGMTEIQYTEFGNNDYIVNNVNVNVRTELISLIFGLNYRF